jgi:hypothetical protein
LGSACNKKRENTIFCTEMDKFCRRCRVAKTFPEQFRSKQICLECAPDVDGYPEWAEARHQRLTNITTVLRDVPKADRSWYRRIFHLYGITPADYQALLNAQGGGCAICGLTNSGRDRLAVDHDHKTGTVRGLLCHGCNIGLGNFHDSPTNLQKAIAYLGGPRGS